MLWSVIIENGTISATLPRGNMTKEQKIEAAKQRIAELERLIKAWQSKS
tara:strand:- start:1593 stop:1739 length:147 start_codon:yes stop_codon:yes gene_type:complete